ncbi:HPT domain superfamily [Arabidopsis suecica]|uniref:HPT domain superfamily n=1 Tax=Arabidopsis suecica TaxID=45249 RepID=A0A8T2DBR2_ARASU|nr:HPT domain superfamily [Arabidopsis suecica]
MVIKSLHLQVEEMRQSFFDEGARANRGTHDYQMHSSVRKQQRQASYNIFVIIGAIKVVKELKKANTFLKAGNIEGVKAALRDIKKEHSELRAKFETYFQLMRQAGPTDVAVNSS